jgi:hypothetical protein
MGPMRKGLAKCRLEVVEGGVMVKYRWQTKDVVVVVTDGRRLPSP